MAKHNPQSPQFSRTCFTFLQELKQNNNRDWFTAHKTDFEVIQQQLITFADALLAELNKHDVIETPSGKKALYRIYRDTRFSANKTPFKGYWSGRFGRATRYRRGGYYFHIEQGNSYMAGGFYGPNPADLKLIREDIAFDPQPLRKILNAPSFITSFKTLHGEQLKTTPKGFAADNEAINLLRYKQFLLVQPFTDEEVLSKDFVQLANQAYVNMRQFFDYMSEVLAADVNGIALG